MTIKTKSNVSLIGYTFSVNKIDTPFEKESESEKRMDICFALNLTAVIDTSTFSVSYGNYLLENIHQHWYFFVGGGGGEGRSRDL